MTYVLWYLLGIQLVSICNCVIRNLALNKPTNSSGYYNTNEPSRAVDGIDGTQAAHGSCYHSQTDALRWWEVDLQDNFYVTSVSISTNERGGIRLLRNFSIHIYGDGDIFENASLCYHHPGAEGNSTIRMYFCSSIILGRHVRVTAYGTRRMILCEVRVFGSEDMISAATFQPIQGVEVDGDLAMTYTVPVKSVCAMRCYLLPTCRVFRVKAMSSYYNCDVLTDILLKANSTGNPNEGEIFIL